MRLDGARDMDRLSRTVREVGQRGKVGTQVHASNDLKYSPAKSTLHHLDRKRVSGAFLELQPCRVD